MSQKASFPQTTQWPSEKKAISIVELKKRVIGFLGLTIELKKFGVGGNICAVLQSSGWERPDVLDHSLVWLPCDRWSGKNGQDSIYSLQDQNWLMHWAH